PSTLSCYSSHPPPHLPSFPTRRSSDLFRFGKTSAQFAEDLSKLENPLLAGKPPRRAQGAARKAFTAPRRVPQRDGIVRRIETDLDRKSTRLNSSHVSISYAVFCLKKKI